MAKISLAHAHTLGKSQARQVVEQVVAELASKHQIQSVWHGDTLNIKRSGLDGTLAVTDEAVNIQVNLGFLLSAVKPIIEREINEELDARLS